MQFQCPACQNPITANVAKPGKFQPKCPKCGTQIVIRIQVSLVDEQTHVEPAPKRSAPVKAPAPRHVLKEDPDSTFASAPGKPAADDSDRTAPQSAPDNDRTFASESEPEERTEAEQTADFDPAPPSKKSAKKAPVADDGEMPAELGGYEILKRLGKG